MSKYVIFGNIRTQWFPCTGPLGPSVETAPKPSLRDQVVTQLAMVPLLRRSSFGVPDSLWLLVVMGLDSRQLRKIRGKVSVAFWWE